jgi:hypothetical protein
VRLAQIDRVIVRMADGSSEVAVIANGDGCGTLPLYEI